jgi:hypothetical protein
MLLEMFVLMLGFPYHQMVIVSYAALEANTVLFLLMNIERNASPTVPFVAKVIAFGSHVVLGHSFARLEKKPE